MAHGNYSYQPKTAFTKWLDSRLPIIRLMDETMLQFPTPKNLNYWFTFGGILAFMLVVQIITGIVLACTMCRTTMAFDSVERIMRDVNYGWLIRYIHSNGASMFFIAVYIHMFRGLYYGSYKAPREVLWILGIVIYLLMMATGFLGYTLPWGQMSFWGATVITNLSSARSQIIRARLGDHAPGSGVRVAVDNPTLQRFFSLHYLLPFVIAGVVVLHIWALHMPGNNNPLGIDVKGPADTVPFHPYYTVKDLFALALFVLFFSYFVFFAPNFLGTPTTTFRPTVW
jgi:ubiquinol-cytochrome c reductase cytochrome b/c1 subunit